MERKDRIIVIEDEETIALGLVSALRNAGYDVVHYDTGEAGLEAILAAPPALLLLDLMLPGIDGLEVLKRAKATHPDLQVIILSAKSEELDRVLGLELGADDYVTKPPALRELLARVKARLRSRQSAEDDEPQIASTASLAFGDIKVDLRRRVLTRGGQQMRLTTHEAGVLAYLIEHKGEAVSREELLENVWGYSPKMATRTVDNQILKLRKKIEAVPSDPRHILTVHGTGYRFEP
jgi:DNA-binding response OmpR family regulator